MTSTSIPWTGHTTPFDPRRQDSGASSPPRPARERPRNASARPPPTRTAHGTLRPAHRAHHPAPKPRERPPAQRPGFRGRGRPLPGRPPTLTLHTPPGQRGPVPARSVSGESRTGSAIAGTIFCCLLPAACCPQTSHRSTAFPPVTTPPSVTAPASTRHSGRPWARSTCPIQPGANSSAPGWVIGLAIGEHDPAGPVMLHTRGGEDDVPPVIFRIARAPAVAPSTARPANCSPTALRPAGTLPGLPVCTGPRARSGAHPLTATQGRLHSPPARHPRRDL